MVGTLVKTAQGREVRALRLSLLLPMSSVLERQPLALRCRRRNGNQEEFCTCDRRLLETVHCVVRVSITEGRFGNRPLFSFIKSSSV